MEEANRNPKLTWKEFFDYLRSAGIHEDDEIDKIDISWGRPDQLSAEKDEDFGWQIYL